jgi:hypothetical protein
MIRTFIVEAINVSVGYLGMKVKSNYGKGEIIGISKDAWDCIYYLVDYQKIGDAFHTGSSGTFLEGRPGKEGTCRWGMFHVHENADLLIGI